VALPTGIEMRYVEAGEPDGETVVFLHGYTDSSLSFGPTIDALLERRPDLRVLALDLRGHGGSSLPPAEECAAAPERCFRVEDLARDALAFLEAMGIERTHLVGHSYGSMVAQVVALEAPDKVASLALLASAARVGENPVIGGFVLGQLIEGTWRPALEGRGVTWPAEAYRLTPLDVDSAAEEWLLANWVTEIAADPAYLAQMAQRTSRVPLGAWLGVARAALRFDNVERLAELSVPTLVLWASQDGVTSPADQVVLRSALDVASRGCRTTYVSKRYGREPLPASGFQESDFGHNFQWGAAEQVAADLASWFAEGAPTADLHYLDPSNPRVVVTAPGEAELEHGPPCS
jgi:pimeloyl-ACP methyl ester carboxylesterase